MLVPIETTEAAFQTIDLPAGDTVIEFAYAPRGFGPALAAAGIGLGAVLVLIATGVARGGRTVRV